MGVVHHLHDHVLRFTKKTFGEKTLDLLVMENIKDYLHRFHRFVEENISFDYLHSLNLSPIQLGVSCAVILITTCFLYTCVTCLWRRNRKKNKIRVLGRIKDITVHSGGGNKKSVLVDPFLPSNLDFQRRFEEEIAQFLYLLGVECIQHKQEAKNLTFNDMDGKPCSDTMHYILEYRWLLKHYAINFRDYGHILVQSKCSRQQVFQSKDPSWTVEEVLTELNTNNGVNNSVEVIVSWACRFRDLCHNLRDKFNRRIHNNGYIQEVFEEARTRDNVLNAMSDGLLLVELIKAAVSPLPKALKDHYYNITSLQRIYREEYISFVSLSRNNKRKLDKMDDMGTIREIMLQHMEEILTKGGEDALEVMATAVLPRFNCHVDQM